MNSVYESLALPNSEPEEVLAARDARQDARTVCVDRDPAAEGLKTAIAHTAASLAWPSASCLRASSMSSLPLMDTASVGIGFLQLQGDPKRYKQQAIYESRGRKRMFNYLKSCLHD